MKALPSPLRRQIDPSRLGVFVRNGARQDARSAVHSLSIELSAACAGIIRSVDASELTIGIVGRGGLLMYPAFAVAFPGARYVYLGIQRDGDGEPDCSYVSRIDERSELLLLIDCLSATGSSLLLAQTVLEATACPTLAATLGSSTLAADRLAAANFSLVAFSLQEAIVDGLVVPDLGGADAGDLLS